MKDEEIWKDITGYEGYYQVSNLARIRSVDRITTKGRFLKERILNPSISSTTGYFGFTLARGRTKKYGVVHRLMMLEFVPNPDNKQFINHKNSIRTDNRLENLEWCTPQENSTHAKLAGTTTSGEKNPAAKLTSKSVLEIRKSIGISNVELSKMYSVGIKQISLIKNRRVWQHI